MFAPPRNGSRRFSPPAPFREDMRLRAQEGVSRSAERDQRLCLWTSRAGLSSTSFSRRLRRLRTRTIVR
ncbi:MAG: hypothetical protein HDT21_10005 [Ruminococcus sp.]|nr:hypothetical protein [Ruminococcus sp.]